MPESRTSRCTSLPPSKGERDPHLAGTAFDLRASPRWHSGSVQHHLLQLNAISGTAGNSISVLRRAWPGFAEVLARPFCDRPPHAQQAQPQAHPARALLPEGCPTWPCCSDAGACMRLRPRSGRGGREHPTRGRRRALPPPGPRASGRKSSRHCAPQTTVRASWRPGAIHPATSPGVNGTPKAAKRSEQEPSGKELHLRDAGPERLALDDGNPSS